MQGRCSRCISGPRLPVSCPSSLRPLFAFASRLLLLLELLLLATCYCTCSLLLARGPTESRKRNTVSLAVPVRHFWKGVMMEAAAAAAEVPSSRQPPRRGRAGELLPRPAARGRHRRNLVGISRKRPVISSPTSLPFPPSTTPGDLIGPPAGASPAQLVGSGIGVRTAGGEGGEGSPLDRDGAVRGRPSRSRTGAHGYGRGDDGGKRLAARVRVGRRRPLPHHRARRLPVRPSGETTGALRTCLGRHQRIPVVSTTWAPCTAAGGDHGVARKCQGVEPLSMRTR